MGLFSGIVPKSPTHSGPNWDRTAPPTASFAAFGSSSDGGRREERIARFDGRQNVEVEVREAYDRVTAHEERRASQSTTNIAATFDERFRLKPIYQRSFARAGLAIIVFLPLLLMPVHGFMRANGIDDVTLAAYILLLVAFVLCILLAPPDAASLPKQVIDPVVRLVYACSFFVAPVLTRSVDWAAYTTIPLGVLGLLVVRNPRAMIWLADVYVLALIVAPSASITLAYTLDLQDTIVASNLSVTEWQARGGGADAFAFTDGYVATMWKGRRTEWSRETGGSAKSMTSEYGVAPVLASRACVVNASEFEDEKTSRCPVVMMVMYSQTWEDADDDEFDTHGAVNRQRHHSCTVQGHVRAPPSQAMGGRGTTEQANGAGLCVYADPLYRGHAGTPIRAVEECRMLIARHGLYPLDICETQYFLVDHDEDHRRRNIVHQSIISCLLVVAGVGVGLHPRTRHLSDMLKLKMVNAGAAVHWRLSHIDML